MRDLIDAAAELIRQSLRVILLDDKPTIDEDDQSEKPSD